MSTKPRFPLRFRRKVVIYATWRDQILVFEEPDFPHIGLQVPGGTVADDETVEEAARREFEEETGLDAPDHFEPLGEMTYVYEADEVRHQHLRHYFHVELAGEFPERWEWTEETPDDGGKPIRFAYSWAPLLPVVPVLFGRLDALFPELLRRLEQDETEA
ncbi:NUDIX domain-containing protein [Kaistia dalseonensis]|uniref:ADP-ribose pyrophosphatase YjhB (NUDIX family) n=1 Tax=Kaistia dalseonensis TaxID=410840 RepID=A0ABU0H5Z5_9HYPH|nr:NUDIX domain-containing protein [Kaistia dalseonensis]MCX5494712.1 NUDIX domain-containing protein [Kaistia dalseonensis]MDQ0437293.1 ADP-ribose pyrophosphatase YjhB (NUDIX family) [Kaistia dalseonensis]